ncbi:MAG: ABC transporter ATP-binding protein [Planctomycetota bacterium]
MTESLPPTPANPPNGSGDADVLATGLRFGYRKNTPVVDGVDFRLDTGRVHCLLGDSGSGKTTLLRLIAGLERPDEGEIKIAGQLVSGGPKHLPAEDRPIGMVFQDYALFPHLSVRKNVAFGMRHRPRAERRAIADELLQRVGMSGFETAMPYTLSGGQQQRVALARALARDPKVMLLDEPFSGLDAAMRDAVRETTLKVMREAGVAVLMVTHDPREALVAADTVSVMRRGKITATGRPEEVCVRRQEYRGEGAQRVQYERIEVRGTDDTNSATA